MNPSPRREYNPTPAAGGASDQVYATENINRAIVKGSLWMILGRMGDRSLGFVSTLILVRLLAPADFGLVAMAGTVIALCELLGQVGLDVALIQNPRANRLHYDTAWTFTIILATITAVALVLLADPAARFYGEPRLVPILLALAAASLISGFENIGIIAFRKTLRFDKEFQFVFGKKIAGFLITVPLAFMLRSYWALVAGIIGGRLAGVCLSYFVQEYRPRLSLGARQELFHFSKWMVISNIAVVFYSRAAQFFVGKIVGAHALGVFSVSYELSNLPTSELTAPINRAVYPGYARKAAEGTPLKDAYLDVFSIMVAFGVPMGVGIAATAGILIPLLLGPQWTEAIPVVEILAIYGVFAVMRSNANYVYLAEGKPYIATYLAIGLILLLLPALAVLCREYGTIGAAYAFLGTDAVSVLINFAVLYKVLDVTVREILGTLWRPVLSSALMFAIVRVVPQLSLEPYDKLAGLIHLVAVIASGGVAYLGCLYALWIMAARPVGAESRFVGFVQSAKCQLWFRSVSGFSR
jgi:lipopolysaccharide exporter